MPFLRHILRHRSVDLTHFVPVYAGHEQIGWTKRDFAKLLGQFDFAWVYTDDRLTVNQGLDGFDRISQVIHDVFLEISAQGHYPLLPDYSAMGGDDWLPVGQERWTDPLFRVHRFYSTCLGIRRENIVLHGYEDEHIWLAVRGREVEDHVGLYDLIASGCITMGQTIKHALLHEAEEECGLPDDAMKHVKSGAELYLMYHNSNGFILDEIYHVFDLETKNLFTPSVIKKSEVDHFEKLSVIEVIELLKKTERVKPQMAFMLIDFLIRYGHLKSDMSDYAHIVKELTTPYSVAA